MTEPRSEASLAAPYSLEFPFERTVGDKVGTFLGGLRDGLLYGVRLANGDVVCPPAEFDPLTAEETGELVRLEPAGSVVAYTWVPARPGDVVDHDFAWALIAIDGTAGSFLHAVDAGGDRQQMRIGLRVRARWRDERVGDITDIECFEPVR